MLEKGRYTKAADLSLKEREAMDTMYEAGSLMTTQDASAHTLALTLQPKTSSLCHSRSCLSSHGGAAHTVYGRCSAVYSTSAV